jgi:hypothetical protein
VHTGQHTVFDAGDVTRESGQRAFGAEKGKDYCRHRAQLAISAASSWRRDASWEVVGDFCAAGTGVDGCGSRLGPRVWLGLRPWCRHGGDGGIHSKLLNVLVKRL